MNEVLTMKKLIVNCLAIYGAYSLAVRILDDKCGIEITFTKKDIPEQKPEISAPKKGWTLSVSR